MTPTAIGDCHAAFAVGYQPVAPARRHIGHSRHRQANGGSEEYVQMRREGKHEADVRPCAPAASSAMPARGKAGPNRARSRE